MSKQCPFSGLELHEDGEAGPGRLSCDVCDCFGFTEEETQPLEDYEDTWFDDVLDCGCCDCCGCMCSLYDDDDSPETEWDC